MTALQILAVLLAGVASCCFFLTARLLGPDGTGWHGAHIGWRWALDGLALFWLAAAVYALSHPAIVRLSTLVLAVLFAKLALIVLVINLRRRVPPAH